MNLFEGTAEYYRRFRSGVPEAVAQLLDDAAPRPVDRPRRLLDIGTGTGFVIEALKGRFDDAIGIDADPALLDVTRTSVTPRPDQQIRFELAPAEAFHPPPGWAADLVTICRTFHWLDRPTVLNRLDAPNGVVAIFGDNSIWVAKAAWKDEIQTVLHEFLGQDRRAGTGTYRRLTRPYTDDLETSAFSRWRRVVVPVQRRRSADSILGYLHSTSFAAPHLFGARLHEFDTTLAARLAPLAHDGLYVDDNAFDLLLATRP